MPIINGTYVNDTLGSAKSAQNAVFGDYTRRDMNDYSTAAYNYLMKQQEQAYNLELWNLQNQYNSPAEQMKRFQDAGLNPNLIYQQQNTAAAPQAASASSFRPQNTAQKNYANAMSTIGQIMQTVKAARDTYDYLQYGRETSRWNMISAQENALAQKMENSWNDYLLHGDNMIYGDATRLPSGPKATMYRYQMNTQYQRYEQLRAIVAGLPDQYARTRALQALDDYRLQILQGQYGAIMSINTGSQGVDSFLRMLGFYLLGR